MDLKLEQRITNNDPQQLQSGELDILPLLAETEARRHQADFSVPVLRLETVVVVRRDDNEFATCPTYQESGWQSACRAPLVTSEWRPDSADLPSSQDRPRQSQAAPVQKISTPRREYESVRYAQLLHQRKARVWLGVLSRLGRLMDTDGKFMVIESVGMCAHQPRPVDVR